MANYLGGARRVLEGPAPEGRLQTVRDALTAAVQRAVEAGQIVRRMRSFMAPDDGSRRPQDLRCILEEALDLAGPAARRAGVEVRLEPDPLQHCVVADRAQLRQVLVSLMHNAIEAMEGGEAPRRLTVVTRATPERMVEVSVADTGPGIPAEIAEDLFRSFVTTKRGGLGVGLPICRGIVEAHGGRIQAEPNPGGGTVFRFTLHAARMEGETVGEPAQPDPG